jgi:hypothetical protein
MAPAPAATQLHFGVIHDDKLVSKREKRDMLVEVRLGGEDMWNSGLSKGQKKLTLITTPIEKHSVIHEEGDFLNAGMSCFVIGAGGFE